MNNSLPIIVMTRNEAHFLLKCIDSILDSVSIPVHIYIVDNSSDDNEHIAILNEIESRKCGNISIIKNRRNLWILGLNNSIERIRENHSSKYFFLTDGDINFEFCAAKPCWLSYLIDKMEKNISIGKIGLSLDWSYLLSHKDLSDVLEQEKGLYSERNKIDDLYVSFVDTTASLFRWDWSIDGTSKFYPDHMRYLRPELYSCRTPRNILVEHLGWQLYSSPKSMLTKNVNQKVLCFSLVGGDVKKEILAKSSLIYRVFYKLFSKTIKRGWYLRRYYYLLKYTLCKGIKLYDGQGSFSKQAPKN